MPWNKKSPTAAPPKDTKPNWPLAEKILKTHVARPGYLLTSEEHRVLTHCRNVDKDRYSALHGITFGEAIVSRKADRALKRAAADAERKAQA